MIQPDSYVRSLLKRSPGETVTARGWVKTRRERAKPARSVKGPAARPARAKPARPAAAAQASLFPDLR